MIDKPPHAKKHLGVWLPETEEHFADWMSNSKHAKIIDGLGVYQHHKLEAAIGYLPPDRRRFAVDIGGHVGLWAMWLVDYFRHVDTFEPVPLFADILPFNMRGRTNWTLHRYALGNEAGTVSITVPEAQTGGAHIANRNPVNVKYNPNGKNSTFDGIEMRTLDSFGFDDVDFIKIDVEGYELPVVRGARETILRCRPNVVVEQKGNDTAFGDTRNAAADYLRVLGMRSLCPPMSGDWIMGW